MADTIDILAMASRQVRRRFYEDHKKALNMPRSRFEEIIRKRKEQKEKKNDIT